jgi:hypothetical protein
MSPILLVTIGALLAAIVLIEFRAVRAGDERRHHATGYAYVLIGLVAIVSAIAMALTHEALLALVLAVVGFVAVAFGSTRGFVHMGPHQRGHLH